MFRRIVFDCNKPITRPLRDHIWRIIASIVTSSWNLLHLENWSSFGQNCQVGDLFINDVVFFEEWPGSFKDWPIFFKSDPFLCKEKYRSPFRKNVTVLRGAINAERKFRHLHFPPDEFYERVFKPTNVHVFEWGTSIRRAFSQFAGQ